MARQLVLRIRRLDLLYFDEAFVSDMMLADAPSGVIVNALRWEILNDWVQYLNGDTSKDRTAEMSYRWGFVKRDTGFESLKCLWGKHEHNYPMFAETVWLSAAEGSGNGAEARGGSGRAAMRLSRDRSKHRAPGMSSLPCPGPVVCPTRSQIFPAAVAAIQSAASASVMSRACVGWAVEPCTVCGCE